MRKNRTALTIIAVAVILVAFTSVSAYYEMWEDWVWSEGDITYNSHNYHFESDELFWCDSTVSTVDPFYVPEEGILSLPFVCTDCSTADTIYLYIDKDDVDASKPTGQSGTKAITGTWEGTAYVVSANRTYPVEGDIWGDCDYGTNPWTWDGDADLESTPSVMTGVGEGSGDIEYTSSSEPCDECE
ncbi:hypothetical protein GF338_00950 [candidate division WOR-3 bacterium]|nr:hypothetical protein [candidate division WOR-3 bacterium]